VEGSSGPPRTFGAGTVRPAPKITGRCVLNRLPLGRDSSERIPRPWAFAILFPVIRVIGSEEISYVRPTELRRDDRHLTYLDSTDIPLVHLGFHTTNRLVRNREKSMPKKSAVGFSCLGQNLQDRSRNRRTRSPTPVGVSAAKWTICRRPSRLGSRRAVSALSVGPPPESADRNPQCIHRCEQAVNASEERA
jgi:hypothetical protein